MKTYLECLSEAADQIGKIDWSTEIKLTLWEHHLELLQKAADIYASQSNSHKHGVSGKRPTLKEIAQAKDEYLKKVGYVDRMDIIAHDFVEGIAWAIQHYQAAGASGAVDKTVSDENKSKVENCENCTYPKCFCGG